MSRLWRQRNWVYAAIGAGLLLTPFVIEGQPTDSWPPPRLRDTGLYNDWASRTIAPANLPYSPQYPLWSDGAAKYRWMRLPRGTSIDASNPDVWRFPVGTKFWKEFQFGRRVETRFIELTRAGWQFAAYQWNEDETDAVLAPEAGIRQSAVIHDGVRHAIPSRSDCRACHVAGPVRILGVTALQLSPDRDPLAPHAETPPPDAMDLTSLVARGLIRGLPAALLASPPRVVAPTPTARAALGYLQANCGGCHNDVGELKSLDFTLSFTVKRTSSSLPRPLLTALGRPSRFKLSASPETVERICAGQPDKSMVVARMESRNPLVQMPPLGTRLVDTDAVQLIRRWIAEDLAAQTPSSGGGSHR
jgi:hypothetical protein